MTPPFDYISWKSIIVHQFITYWLVLIATIMKKLAKKDLFFNLLWKTRDFIIEFNSKWKKKHLHFAKQHCHYNWRGKQWNKLCKFTNYWESVAPAIVGIVEMTFINLYWVQAPRVKRFFVILEFVLGTKLFAISYFRYLQFLGEWAQIP